MRNFILIAALVLASTTAQAGDNRSLITQVPSDEPVAAAEQKPVDAPKYVARPSAVDKTAEQPREKAEAKRPVAEKPTRASRTERLRRRSDITEARVIQELNRHGIHW